MQKTKIPWADYTCNPIKGCFPASEGCANCYAAGIAKRFSGPGLPFEGLANKNGWTGKICFSSKEMEALDKLRDRPQRIFISSMNDLFYPGIPESWLLDLWVKMVRKPETTFCILTKRAVEMSRWLQYWKPVPAPNVWIGVSVENQARANERIPLLLRAPAARRFISAEPMIGPIGLEDRWLGFGETEPAENRIDWVICGSESGPRRRPFDARWARNLCCQCDRAGIPFFLKQGPDETGKIVEMPFLYGRVWDQVPE